MLNNAEPCRRALCSCCVRRTMKDSPSDSWLHLAGSISLSLSFSLSLLLPSLLCGPEWQGDSRLGISQSLPSSSVPSACQPGFWFQWEMGHYWEKGGEGVRETLEETKQDWLGENRDEAKYRGWTHSGRRAEGKNGGCHKCKDRTARVDWERERHAVQFK